MLNYPHTTECIDVDTPFGQRTGLNKVYNKSNIDVFMSHHYEKFMIKPIMAVQPDKASATLKKYYNLVL
jgi:hypothetical protein